jgi:ribosomal protein S18 acetylase RimI-like enzyme
VHESWRGRGLGTALIAFAERRILRDQPNVFICVSSFNARARRLYERLGYEVVGELKDFVVRGHSEFLLRKSTGPLAEHVPRSERAENT